MQKYDTCRYNYWGNLKFNIFFDKWIECWVTIVSWLLTTSIDHRTVASGKSVENVNFDSNFWKILFLYLEKTICFHSFCIRAPTNLMSLWTKMDSGMSESSQFGFDNSLRMARMFLEILIMHQSATTHIHTYTFCLNNIRKI